MYGTVLVVDDDDDAAQLLRDLLRKRGFNASAVTSGQQCLEHLRTHSTDVVVTDIRMPGMSGIDLCVTLRQRHPDLLPIVITGQTNFATATDAIRAGAYDLIAKPVNIDAVEVAVSRALKHLTLVREVKRLRATAGHDVAIAGITGDSPAMHQLFEMVRLVGDSDASVLITGESGTGKELVARALHNISPRRDRPFVAVNCAAMPASLLESELFGHVRGAFTDAKQDRKGLFVRAGGGTILLDEIGDMPPEMQVKLLRVLQQRTVRPVGGDEEIPFNARVITSTNRDLDAEVADRRFRKDLFYRINVVQIAVPPLRDRAGDVLSLAQHFVDELARRTKKPVRGISAAAAERLGGYGWPGNVRELENCMERAVALCRLDEITIDDLPVKVQNHRSSQLANPTDSPSKLITLDEDTIASSGALVTLQELERRYIDQVLEVMGGNKTDTARILGIDRRSLYRRLRDLNEPRQSAADLREGATVAASWR